MFLVGADESADPMRIHVRAERVLCCITDELILPVVGHARAPGTSSERPGDRLANWRVVFCPCAFGNSLVRRISPSKGAQSPPTSLDDSQIAVGVERERRMGAVGSPWASGLPCLLYLVFPLARNLNDETLTSLPL